MVVLVTWGFSPCGSHDLDLDTLSKAVMIVRIAVQRYADDANATLICLRLCLRDARANSAVVSWSGKFEVTPT